MTTLYLTPSEQQLFQALPSDLREGWTVEAETHGYNDTPPRMELRMALLRIHDPRLVAFREQVQTAKTIEEVVELIKLEDLSKVDEDDMAALFFALGPQYISSMIEVMLGEVTTDKDVEGITALTVIRHTILQAFVTTSRSR